MKSEIYFSLKTPLNIEVRTTFQYWEYLVTFKHPVMEGKADNGYLCQIYVFLKIHAKVFLKNIMPNKTRQYPANGK